MVYLYKKKVGDKDYYYLRASLSKGKKQVTKDIAYLGTEPANIKEKLSALPQEYQKEIRKTYKTIHRFLEINYFLEKIKEEKLKQDSFLSKKQLEAIEACKLHWNTKFKELPQESQAELLQDFIVEFSFNTASIEGNTITLKEAEKLLVEQRTPKDRTLREVYDIQNTKVVFFTLLEKLPTTLTHDLIQSIHGALLNNIDNRKGYRTQDIRVTKSRFTSSPAQYVSTDMGLLLEWLEQYYNKLHPVVLATLFHHKFERIHPFFDGNGRTGRMLANSLLLKADYPPLIIRKKNRKNYLDALSKADKADLNSTSIKDYGALIEFVVAELTENYWNVFL